MTIKFTRNGRTYQGKVIFQGHVSATSGEVYKIVDGYNTVFCPVADAQVMA